MIKKTVTLLATLLCSAVAALPVIGADSGTEPEKGAEVAAKTEKLIDLSNPEKALNPDTWVRLYDMAKDWLITNGPSIVVAILILIIGRWVAMWVADIGKRAMVKGKIDITLASFLSKLIYYALLAAVVIAAADQMGIKTTSFVAIFGAAGLAIGLALKDSLANFASGVMLILFRPFKVGDVVTAGGVTGKVQQIDIFSTIIMTADNQKIIVPNSGITSGVITNVNAEPTRRIDLVIGIGYDDDIRKAKATLERIIGADGRVLKDPAPTIAVAELADSSVNLVLRPWVKSEDYWDVRFNLVETIKLTFDEEGISFPFPQQDVHMHQVTQ